MRIFVSSFLLMMATVTQATGLYDPVPPPNSAFVRIAGIATATLHGQAVTAPRNGVSPYVVVPQGEFAMKVGGITTKLKVRAGNFYTVIQNGGRVVLLTDQAAENRAKALLTVYNLSRAPGVDLKTADGKTAVVTGVKPGASGSRAVNGITVDLSAFAGAKVLGTVKSVKLERGNAYALVVTDAGVTLTTSSTKTK